MSVYFKNQLRGYRVVIPTLQALSKDLCRKCIGLDGAKIKVIKGLKKLRTDLDNFNLSEEEKREITTSLNGLLEIAEGIDVAEETTCQKTAGNCKIGQACLPLDGALGLMKQVTEPKLTVAIPELAASKIVDVRQACCPDTLSAPIKEAIKDMKPGEVLEVIIAPSLKDLFNKFIEQGNYQLIKEMEKGEEIHCKIRLK